MASRPFSAVPVRYLGAAATNLRTGQAAAPAILSLTATSEPVRGLSLSPTATYPRMSLTATPQSSVSIEGVGDRMPGNRLNNSAELEAFCRKVPFRDWIYAADSLQLEPDLSKETRERLHVVYRPSCNYDHKNSPQAVILHFTRGDFLEGAIATLRNPGGPSIHYIIDRDGTVVQMVPESMAAAHVSCDTREADCPALGSIGIELVNRGQVNPDYFFRPIFEDYQMSFGWRWWEDYPEAQLQALRWVVFDLTRRWGIPLDPTHVLGHYRINQKADPGPALNLFWTRFGNPVRPAIFGERR